MTNEAIAYKPELVRASAGTGKTFQLTNRLISLLAAGERPERILATTFTRKAAGEIQSRLFLRLAEAALDESKARELSECLDGQSFGSDKSLELLEELVNSQHRLSICTLDSLFIRIAKSFSLELGLSPSWEIVDSEVSARLCDEAIGAVLREEPLDKLSGLVQLLRGGFGRSVHVYMARTVLELLEVFRESPAAAWAWLMPPQGLSDQEFDKALSRLETAELPLTKDGKPNKRWFSTRENDIEAARAGDWESFLGRGISGAIAKGKEDFYRTEIPEKLQDAYQELLSHVGSDLISELRNRTLATYELLRLFDTKYEEQKLSSGSLHFGDVKYFLSRASLLSELEDVYFRLDSTIAHLLLDEFQDTSRDEWRILEPLADEILSKCGADNSFFCVGDVKQAIYGWRGGVSEIFDTLANRHPVLGENSMETSYRSALPVVEMVNTVFSGISRNPALEEYYVAAECWSRGFEEHRTARDSLSGYARLLVSPCSGEDENEEESVLCYAAKKVKEIVCKAPTASVGVLVRTNKAVSRLIYELRKESINIFASEEGGNPLVDSPAVTLILSALKLSDHPGDSISRYHLATSPLGKLLGFEDFGEERAAEEFSQGVRGELIASGYGRLLSRWAELFNPMLSERDRARVGQLVEIGYAFDKGASLRVMDFVKHVRAKRVEDVSASQVRVMTIHQAKGLEFDVVVLPELSKRVISGMPPRLLVHRRDAISAPERVVCYAGKTLQTLSSELCEMAESERADRVKESLSVLYVSLTRAKSAVYMIIPPSKESEKKLPASHAGILRGALFGSEPVELEQLLYETGDKEWWKCFADETRGLGERAEFIKEVPLKPNDKRRVRGLLRKSPSSLEGGEAVRLSQRMRVEGGAALQRGRLLHAFFETIEWLDGETPTREQLLKIARQRGVHAEGVDEVLSEFYEIIELQEIQTLLSNKSYEEQSEVFYELPFAFREENTLFTGSIDRLVLERKDGKLLRAEIVDFKSDRLSDAPGQSLEEKVDYYYPQVDTYRKAVQKVMKIDASRVSAKLAFVSEGKVVLVFPGVNARLAVN